MGFITSKARHLANGGTKPHQLPGIFSEGEARQMEGRNHTTVADALASWAMDSGTVDGATSARSKASIWHLASGIWGKMGGSTCTPTTQQRQTDGQNHTSCPGPESTDDVRAVSAAS